VVAGLNGDFDAGFAKSHLDASLNYGELDSRFVNSSLRSPTTSPLRWTR